MKNKLSLFLSFNSKGKNPLKREIGMLKGFTIVELIVAIAISAIVLIVVFKFVADAIYETSYSNKETEFLTNFNDFRLKFNNYKNLYPEVSYFGTGNNVAYLKNTDLGVGALIGVVDNSTLKLTADDTKYSDLVLGFRDLNSIEIGNIDGDNSVAYNLIFQRDKIFPDIKIKKYEIIGYNSGSLLHIDLEAIMNYSDEKVGILWSNFYEDTILKLKVVF